MPSVGNQWQSRLEDYAQAFENLSHDNLAAQLTPLFAQNARFKDPFNDVTGLPAIIAIFEHLFQTLDAPQFNIIHTALKGEVGYIHWAFQFRFKGELDVKSFEGLSQVQFTAQGLVQAHIDYWDSGEVVYAKVPVLGWLVRWIAQKLSVH
ncbi:MAG: nuclear transport factor 2 family protein [Thiotrichales bacterium]|nr:nuclear transport factor 2 family protein [Thiotrichales bacterium]